jgi:hypothetical protein
MRSCLLLGRVTAFYLMVIFDFNFLGQGTLSPTGVNPCKTPTGDSVPREPPGLRHEGLREGLRRVRTSIFKTLLP